MNRFSCLTPRPEASRQISRRQPRSARTAIPFQRNMRSAVKGREAQPHDGCTGGHGASDSRPMQASGPGSKVGGRGKAAALMIDGCAPDTGLRVASVLRAAGHVSPGAPRRQAGLPLHPLVEHQLGLRLGQGVPVGYGLDQGAGYAATAASLAERYVAPDRLLPQANAAGSTVLGSAGPPYARLWPRR